MRQHSVGSSSNSRGGADPVIKCNCGRNVVVRTVKKGVNVGRNFYGWPFWPDTQCSMFRWISDINDGEEVQYRILERDTTIAELELGKKVMEEKIKRLQVKKENLEEELQELKTELGQIRIELLNCSRNEKNFSMALLFSWIFFAFLVFYLKVSSRCKRREKL